MSQQAEKFKVFIGNHDGQPDAYLPSEVYDALGVGIGDGVEITVRDGKAVMEAADE